MIETNRLLIRKPENQDIQAYLKFRNSDYVLKHNPMGKLSLDDVKKEFNENKNIWLIQIKDRDVIGAIFTDRGGIRYWKLATEISYFLDESYSNLGYMSEAVKAFLSYLFNDGEIELVTVRVFAKNSGSLKMVKKLGFTQDGYFRKCVDYNNQLWDDVVFSMTKEEFNND